MYSMKKKRTVMIPAVLVMLAVLIPPATAAGTDGDRDKELERLKEQIEELQQRLAALENQGSESEDELQQLLQEAERAGGADKPGNESRTPAPGASGQRNQSAMNPEISFLGDFSYDWTDGARRDEFFLRGAELALQAPLDPYTRFKAFIVGEQEPTPFTFNEPPQNLPPTPGEELTVKVEEAYLEWVGLPLHTRVRLGKFRQQFGTLNRWHQHALPSVDRPLAQRNVFGDEGLIGLGVSIDFQLPSLWATSNGLTVEITNADNSLAYAGAQFNDPAILLRHTGFFDLGKWSYLELGFNGLTGPNNERGDRNTRIGGVDFNYLWEPEGKGKYRGLEVRGEFIRSLFERSSGDIIGANSWYTYLQWQLARNWYVGMRYDDAELASDRVEMDPDIPFVAGLGETAWTGFVTFWQSEFVRLRFQVQDAQRDVALAAGPMDDTRAWFQVTFAGGPHKHESY